ncbi:hypothetical protein JHK87_055427 [Glycine soja]|nr:hypothetical protein JHK87_055427 [Glycine soja]
MTNWLFLQDDGLLHTTCGTPNYIAPDMISAAEFTFPPWLSFSARKLITKILDPNPMTRIAVPEILRDEWFKKDYKPPAFEETKETNVDDVEAVFKDYKGFKREIRFTSKCPANEIIKKIEEAAKPLGFDVQKKNFKMKLENVKAGRKGNLNVATAIFQGTPSLHVVKGHKAKGDTLEFLKASFVGKSSTTSFQQAWRMLFGKLKMTWKIQIEKLMQPPNVIS